MELCNIRVGNFVPTSGEKAYVTIRTLRLLPLLLLCPSLAQAGAWINEIHYDNAGTDVGERIEVARRLLEETGVGVAPGDAFGPEGADLIRICLAVAPKTAAEAALRVASAWQHRNRCQPRRSRIRLAATMSRFAAASRCLPRPAVTR